MNEKIRISDQKKKLLIIIIAASCALLALAIASAVMLIPLYSNDFVTNSASAIFFNPAPLIDLLSAESSTLDASLTLPADLTGLASDLALSVASSEDRIGKKGRSELSISAGGTDLALDMVYDSEFIAIGGLCPETGDYISLPRTNIKEKLDSSPFSPDSLTVYSLDIKTYNSLLSALQSMTEDSSERDEILDRKLSEIGEKIAKIIKPRSSLCFSDGRLCKMITYTVNKNDICEVLEIIASELESDAYLRSYFGAFTTTDAAGNTVSISSLIRELKGKLPDGESTLTLITDGKYLLSASLSSSSGLNADIDFIYGSDYNGIEIRSNKTNISYKKRITESTLSLELIIDEKTITLEHNKSDHSYSLALDGDELFCGILESDSEKLRFTVESDESATPLVYFSLITPASGDLTLPSHKPLLDMDKDEVSELIRTVSIKPFSDILNTFAPVNLSGIMTADGRPMLFGDRLISEASDHYMAYISLLKTTDKKIIDTVSRIYVWNDRLDAYILFNYSVETDMLSIGCAYELTDEILADYHIANIDNGIMTAHSLKLIERIDTGCENSVTEIYECQYCDYRREDVIKPIRHNIVRLTDVAVGYDNVERFATVEKCDRCNTIISVSILDYCYIKLTPDLSGGYTVTGFSPKERLSYVYVHFPAFKDTALNISGLRLSNPDQPYVAVNIPEGIATLAAYSVPIDSKFEILVLPSTLKEIRNSAFSGSGKPKAIYYCGTEEQWKQINLNQYASLWKDIEVIFCPEGVSYEKISEKLFLKYDIELATARQKELISNIDAARELSGSEGIALICDEKIDIVAYDEVSGLAAVCIKRSVLRSEIKIYDIRKATEIASFSISDTASSLDIRDGYVAMGSSTAPVFYVYDIASASTVKVEADDQTYVTVNQVIVDSGHVYIRTSQAVLVYSIKDKKLAKRVFSSSVSELIFKPDIHRIIAVNRHYSSMELCLIDSSTGAYIKTIDYSSDEASSRLPIPQFENVITTKLGVNYDFDGNITNDTPRVVVLVSVDIPEGLPIISEFYKAGNAAMTLFAESGQRVRLALQGASSASPVILDYYAEKAIVTADGDMLIYTPEGYGLILIELN